MRTTVTLDPDVEALLRQRMKERGEGFKDALNAALRTALVGTEGGQAGTFKQRTFSLGYRPEVALDKALALAAELEDEEIARELSTRK